MSARRGNARGYLAQLANPLPPGEPAFSARSDLSARASRIQPQTPVIEDVIVSGGPRRSADDAVLSETIRLTASDARTLKRPWVDIETETSAYSRWPVIENIETNSAIGVRSVGVSEGPSTATENKSGRVQQGAGERFEAATQSSISSSANRYLNTLAGGDEEIERANGRRSVDARMNVTNVWSAAVPMGLPRSATIAGSVQAEATQSLPPVNPARGYDNLQEFFEGRRREQANPRIAAGAKREPKVVIGTIEIRTRISPVAAQPVPVQGNPESYAGKFNQNGARPALADPVVRSLAWNYGLIQG
jgi:hypothetical protein